jgi:hypothetical protein
MNHGLFSKFVEELKEKKIYINSEFSESKGNLIDFFSPLYMTKKEIDDYFLKLKGLNDVVIRFWKDKENILDEKTNIKGESSLFVKFDERKIKDKFENNGFLLKEIKQDNDFIIVEAKNHLK